MTAKNFRAWIMKWTAPLCALWLHLHPGWRFLVMASVVTLAAGPSATGLYRNWQTEKSITGAVLAMETGQPGDAHRLAMFARENGDERIQERALQVLIRSSDQLGHSGRGAFARELLASQGASPEDRFFAWQVVCRNSSAWMVLAAWELLPEDERSAADFVAVLLDRMLLEEMHDEARKLIDSQSQPLPIELRLRHLRLLASDGPRKSFDPFWRELVDAANQQPAGIARLLPILDELPQQAFAADAASALLAHLPVASLNEPENALRGARLEMASSPEQAEEIFSRALSAFGESAPLATIRWCLQLERLTEARTLLKTVPVDEDPDAFALACLAAERAGRLDGWSILLANPVEATDPLMLCDQAYLAGLLKNVAARGIAEKAAISAATLSSDDGALIRLARHAEQRGLEDFARRVWLEAIRQRKGPLPLAQRLEPLVEYLHAAKKEADLSEVFTTFRLREPGNAVVQARYAYLSCLAGHVSPDALAEELEQLADELPENQHIRFVLASAYLLQSRFEDSLALTDQVETDWLSKNPAFKAVRGIALSGAGRSEEADQWLTGLDWDLLLPSEKRILRNLLNANPIRRVSSSRPESGAGLR